MAEVKEIARQLGGFVATALTEVTGDTWSVEDPGEQHWSVYLVRKGDDGAVSGRVFIRLDGDRVEFTSTYPAHTVWPKPEHVKITAARDKDPKVIARDIARRLLPKYLEEWQRVAEGNERDVRAFAARVAALADLRQVMALDTGREEDTAMNGRWSARLRAINAGNDGAWGDLESNHDGTAFALNVHSLSMEQTREILAIIAKG